MDLSRFGRYREIVDDWDGFLAIQEAPLRPTIWTNGLRLAPDALREHLARDGVELEPLGWHPGAFRWLAEVGPGKLIAHPLGLYHVQEEVSMLPVALLDPRPGESVLDLCAAPGNKTVQAAVAMANRGRVIAVEINRRRLGMIVGSLERLGVTNVAIVHADAGNLPRDFGRYDRVVVDVPCSCEGTVRKHPEVLAHTFAPGFQANVQVSILRKAYKLTKPGGRIVYSTCTYGPEENEAVVDAVLGWAPEGSLRLLEAHVPGFETRPGLVEWQGARYSPELTKAMRVYPHHNDTGGFFVAVLEKAPTAEIPRSTRPRPVGAALEPPPHRDELIARFGVPAAVLDELVIYRGSTKKLMMASRDLVVPREPAAWLAGLPYFRTKSVHPRLASAAALHLGRHATRNAVELDEAQVRQLVAANEVRIDAAQAAVLDGPGWVLPRFRGVVVTVAAFRPDGEGGLLKGSIPRTWKRILDGRP